MGLSEFQQKTYSKGKKAEERFIVAAEKDGYTCFHPTDYEDRWEHWDVKLIKDGKTELVDVKDDKVIHKWEHTWVEFQSVNGEKGWILGDAHAIAVEREDRFDLYDMVKLKEYVEPRRLGLNGYVFHHQPENISEIAYQRCRRPGRLDIFYPVPFSDIEDFIMKTMYK